MSIMTTEDDFNSLFICENLRRLRQAHHLTTTHVANILKKSRQGYLNYENGDREIGIHDLIKLSGFYGVTIDEMVGNPFSQHNNKPMSFRTYEMVDGELTHVMPLPINTANDDVICVKYDDRQVDFFWRTQVHHKNKVMLFEYYNRPYVSKLFYNTDGGGCFFLHDEPFYFTKAHADNIVIIGVFSAKLTKDFTIPNFL
ncbi:MAG: helix-turn-helix transcriptional regulator [Patescibacteria group bacterium]